ncbi:MAG TPA: NAD-dependent epimerase/dehydratase family protein [Solirubrobacteraceae bacterium]|nr:NAD-dependent epimerase/dehydratase family protein [Solirubrobacteraceae bacterium]
MSPAAPGRGEAGKVLVTGGSGFIGRNVVASLRAAGVPVRVIDLEPHPDPDVEIVLGDLAEPDVVRASLAGGISAIVHLAAVTSVLRSVKQPELTYRTNVAATAGLLEAARTAGVRSLVFASTNAVVGPMDGPAIAESSVPRPLTPYGATKAAGEMLMSAYTSSYGLRCACLRLTNVYGPGMALKDSIVARLMRAIRTGSTFEIYGDGRQVRDYVHVADVVAAARLALGAEDWRGPVVIGSGSSLSVLEVIDAVREVTAAAVEVRHGPARPGEMPAVVVDNSVAIGRGWSPGYSLAEGLAGVWEEWSGADVPVAVSQAGASTRGTE